MKMKLNVQSDPIRSAYGGGGGGRSVARVIAKNYSDFGSASLPPPASTEVSRTEEQRASGGEDRNETFVKIKPSCHI